MKLIDKIILAIMICCVLVAIQMYYNERIVECTNNPLTYASKVYEERYGYPFSGFGTFQLKGQSPKIYFDKNGIDIEFPEKGNNINLDDLIFKP